MPAYKDNKTGKWFCKFYYTDWQGNNRQKWKRGFATKKEALAYERDFLEKQSANPDMTFQNLYELYMEDMTPRLKQSAIMTKKHICETHILPFFGNKPVNEIKASDVRRWQNQLMNSQKGYSKTYLKTINNQMSAILNYAIKHYNLSSNPCRAAGSIGRSRAEEMKFWTQEQYEVFSSNIQKSAVKLAFDILFYTGIRSGELLALTPADILSDKRLSINKNFAKIKGQELFLEPKTPKSRRNISLPDFLYDDIQEYVSKLYGIQPTDRIFYFTKSALYKEIKRVAEKVGLPPIRVHDLRHSHASMLIDMGFDILEISERLGHESVKTTLDTYSHLYPEKDTKLAGELNKLRRPARFPR